MWIFGVVVLLLIIGGMFFVPRYMQHKKENTSLSDKFPNLVEWKQKDRIKYILEDIMGESYHTSYVVIFDTHGIWTTNDFGTFSKLNTYKEMGRLHNVLQYIPAHTIVKNVSLEKRKEENALRKKLLSSEGFHNRLTQIQDEYHKLIAEDYSENFPAKNLNKPDISIELGKTNKKIKDIECNIEKRYANY